MTLDDFFTFLSAHPKMVTSFYMTATAAINALPPPTDGGNPLYAYLFRFLHMLPIPTLRAIPSLPSKT